MKAREIIPGWPRGRSTSRHKRVQRPEYAVMPWIRFTVNAFYEESSRRTDYLLWKAEERRKADMMEVWYWIQRSAARGTYYPEPIEDQRLFEAYTLPLFTAAVEELMSEAEAHG